jgi:hypothetical protein
MSLNPSMAIRETERMKIAKSKDNPVAPARGIEIAT